MSGIDCRGGAHPSSTGLPRCFFAGCINNFDRGDKIAELVHSFGFVMASSEKVKDEAFGNSCSGLAKFAMPCSVVSSLTPCVFGVEYAFSLLTHTLLKRDGAE